MTIKTHTFKVLKKTLLLTLFFGTFSFAQSQNIIDTLNVEYINKLTDYYNFQTAKTEFKISEIENKKIKKQLLSDYQDKKKEFLILVKKGIFIEHKMYSNIIAEILNNIKLGNPNLDLKEIKILIAISDEINAYNCGDQIVVINLPLILNFENHLELAYVISHEIAHQKLNHVYASMLKRSELYNSKEVKKKTIEIQKQKFNKGNVAADFVKKIVYTNRGESRKLEHQADSLGYILFKNAYPKFDSYSIKTLKKLKNIDVENDSLVKNDFINYFQLPTLKFNNDWLTSEIAIYNYQKSEKFWNIDSLRTHPDCDARINFLKNKFNIDEKSISVDATNFSALKINADKEYVLGLYFLEEYGRSLYQTLLKLKKNPNDVFLKKMIYDNLIKLQEARNNYTLNKYLETENPKFSESYNQFLCLIRNLRKNELNQIITFYKY